MQVDYKKDGKWLIAKPTGRIDGHTSPDFEASFLEKIAEGNTHFAVDLSKVDYMSSAGLRVLLATYKSLKAASGDMALIAPQAGVAEVLEISGFASIFNIVPKAGDLD